MVSFLRTTFSLRPKTRSGGKKLRLRIGKKMFDSLKIKLVCTKFFKHHITIKFLFCDEQASENKCLITSNNKYK